MLVYKNYSLCLTKLEVRSGERSSNSMRRSHRAESCYGSQVSLLECLERKQGDGDTIWRDKVRLCRLCAPVSRRRIAATATGHRPAGATIATCIDVRRTATQWRTRPRKGV